MNAEILTEVYRRSFGVDHKVTNSGSIVVVGYGSISLMNDNTFIDGSNVILADTLAAREFDGGFAGITQYKYCAFCIKCLAVSYEKPISKLTITSLENACRELSIVCTITYNNGIYSAVFEGHVMSDRVLQGLNHKIYRKCFSKDGWTQVRSRYLVGFHSEILAWGLTTNSLTATRLRYGDALAQTHVEKIEQLEKELAECITFNKKIMTERDHTAKQANQIKKELGALHEKAALLEESKKIARHKFIRETAKKLGGLRGTNMRSAVIKSVEAMVINKPKYRAVIEDICRKINTQCEPSEEVICVVCYTNKRSAVGKKCGHVSICFECSAKLSKCPICSIPTTWIRVYLS